MWDNVQPSAATPDPAPASPKFVFPGIDGLPLRTINGQIPLIKKSDPARLQPQVNGDLKIRIFDLSKSDDITAYAEICDLICKGKYVLSAEERQWVPENKTWMIFLRWVQLYQEMPGNLEKRLHADDEGNLRVIRNS